MMWKVLFFLNFGAFQCTVSTSLPRPTSAIISSVNLRNVLQWTPGNTTDNQTFTVHYAIYGDSVMNDKEHCGNWKAVQGCTEVVQHSCDLTKETSNLEQSYYFRVQAVSRKASSNWFQTTRFDPKLDTNFGPPLVIIKIDNNSANVTVKGPMRYQPNSQMPVVSMETIYPQMMYNLSIKNMYRRKMNHFAIDSEPYKHHLMDYNTEYCFSAKVKFLAMPAQCQSSEWQCITTPTDPLVRQLQWVVVGIVVPFLCVCIMLVIGYILYQYLTGRGQETPYILDAPFLKQPSLTFPEKTNINYITAIMPDPRSDQHFKDPPPQYSLHMPQEPAYNCGDLSIGYGFVSTSSVCGKEERKSCHFSGEDRINLKPKEKHSSGIYVPQATPSYTHRQKHTAPAAWDRAAFHIPLNLKGEILKEDGVATPVLEEKNQNEIEPLLSVYAAQNTKYMFTARTEQSELRLANDEGALGLEETEKDGGGHVEEEEQERGSILIDWDPMTGKLVLPEMIKWIYRRNEPGNGGELSKGAEDGDVREGDLFVREMSEEEAPRELERDLEGGEEVHNILIKWNLIIPMDDTNY